MSQQERWERPCRLQGRRWSSRTALPGHYAILPETCRTTCSEIWWVFTSHRQEYGNAIKHGKNKKTSQFDHSVAADITHFSETHSELSETRCREKKCYVDYNMCADRFIYLFGSLSIPCAHRSVRKHCRIRAYRKNEWIPLLQTIWVTDKKNQGALSSVKRRTRKLFATFVRLTSRLFDFGPTNMCICATA